MNLLDWLDGWMHGLALTTLSTVWIHMESNSQAYTTGWSFKKSYKKKKKHCSWNIIFIPLLCYKHTHTLVVLRCLPIKRKEVVCMKKTKNKLHKGIIFIEGGKKKEWCCQHSYFYVSLIVNKITKKKLESTKYTVSTVRVEGEKEENFLPGATNTVKKN